jgi:hypothetical protein
MTRQVIALIAVLFSFDCASMIAQEKQQPIRDSGMISSVPPEVSKFVTVNAAGTATPGFGIIDSNIILLTKQTVSNSLNLGIANSQGSNQQTPIPKKPTEAPKKHAPPHHTSFEPKWEIEFHGGIFKSHQSGTSVNLPSAQTYSLAGSGARGLTSSRVSSWYFGDGAEIVGLSSSLDPILGKLIVRPQRQIFGIRVSRALRKRVAVEFTFDRGGRLAIGDNALAQVESARASFYDVWKRVSVPGNTPSTSVSTVSRYGGHQIFTTGAILISSAKAHKVSPFLALGAGVLSSSGNTPRVTLVGSYGGPDAQETDTVHLNLAQTRNHAFTGVLGAGIKIYLSRRAGIRLDARTYLYSNPITTLLYANHTNTPDAAWVVNAMGGTSVPFLQRLTGPGISAYSTLSGPSLSGFRTFYGTGLQLQIPVTLGFFWRF